MSDQPYCPGCHYRKYHPDAPVDKHNSLHSTECPLFDLEHAAEHIRRAESRVSILQDGCGYLRNEVALWQGKFRVVKYENNQLRKKIDAAAKECPPEHS